MPRFLSILLSRFGLFASNGLMILLTARWLGANGRGEVSLFLAAISTSGLIAQVFAGIALVYWMPRFGHHRVFKLGLAAQLSMALLLGLFMGPWYGFLGLLHHLTHLYRYYLLAFNKMEEDALVNVVQGITQLLLFIAIYTFSAFSGWLHFALSFGLSYSLALLISIVFFHKALALRDQNLPEMDWRSVNKFLGQGLEVQGGNLLYLSLTRWLFFRLEQVGGLATTGVFSVAIAAVEALLLAASSLAAILMNQVAHNNHDQKLKKQTALIAQVSLLVTVLALGVVWLVPPVFWVEVLGKDYQQLSILLKILSPGIALMSMATVVLHAYSGLGKFKVNLVVVAIALVISVLFSPWLIEFQGVIGATITASLAYSILSILAIIWFSKQYGLAWVVWIPNTQTLSTIVQYVRNRRLFS